METSEEVQHELPRKYEPRQPLQHVWQFQNSPYDATVVIESYIVFPHFLLELLRFLAVLEESKEHAHPLPAERTLDLLMGLIVKRKDAFCAEGVAAGR